MFLFLLSLMHRLEHIRTRLSGYLKGVMKARGGERTKGWVEYPFIFLGMTTLSLYFLFLTFFFSSFYSLFYLFMRKNEREQSKEQNNKSDSCMPRRSTKSTKHQDWCVSFPRLPSFAHSFYHFSFFFFAHIYLVGNYNLFIPSSDEGGKKSVGWSKDRRVFEGWYNISTRQRQKHSRTCHLCES